MKVCRNSDALIGQLRDLRLYGESRQQPSWSQDVSVPAQIETLTINSWSQKTKLTSACSGLWSNLVNRDENSDPPFSQRLLAYLVPT